MIHNYFSNLEQVDFGLPCNLLQQANLIKRKLINHDNGELKNDYLKMRSSIIHNLIDRDKEIHNDDLCFSYTTRTENNDNDNDNDYDNNINNNDNNDDNYFIHDYKTGEA